MRETWGRAPGYRTVFLLGEPGERHLQAALEEESGEHGDIAQAAFADAYRNMTYKHIFGYRWREQEALVVVVLFHCRWCCCCC